MTITEWLAVARIGDQIEIERHVAGEQFPYTIEGRVTGIRRDADRIDVSSIIEGAGSRTVPGPWYLYVTLDPWRLEIELSPWDRVTQRTEP